MQNAMKKYAVHASLYALDGGIPEGHKSLPPTIFSVRLASSAGYRDLTCFFSLK
jgi:hypothetical protein